MDSTTPDRIQARINPGYRWRLGVFSLACLFFGVWSLYDGFVAYPRQRHVAMEFQRFKDEGRIEEWPQYAESLGWPAEEDPGKPKGMWSLYAQYIQAGITMPLGLLWGYWFLKSPGRWIVMDARGIATSWGQKVPFEAIESLNMLRWQSKGIARVEYKDQGTKRALVLDDWKYTREPIVQMVKEVESRLRPEQIIGRPSATQEGVLETQTPAEQ